jgi:apolipoprotein N-acyltransferase
VRAALRYPLCVLTGAALPLAFAPFGQFWVAPLAYAALLWLWRDTRPKQAFLVGFLFGCASFGFGTYWTYIAVRIFGDAPIALAVFLTVGLTVVLALFVGAAGWVAARFFKTTGAVAWLGTLPALFVLFEWLRGWLFSGFGWLSAGYSQTDSWLLGYAPLVGVYGISAVLLVTSGALVTAVLGTRAQRAAALLGVAALWGAGWLASQHHWTTPQDRELTVALVQGAVEQDLKWKPEQLEGMLELYTRLSRQSFGADLIVWPEAAIPTLYEYVPSFLAKLRSAAAEHGSTLLIGILRAAPGGGPEDFQNVLVAMSDPVQFYVKRHLVPFGEYFPVPSFIRSWMRLMSLPYTDATPGKADQPTLAAAGEKIAATICYEDVFGAEQLKFLPEATLLVNVSNDAWFGDSIAPHQHLQIARMRAAEAGRYLLRATNTGVTALIDSQGRVVERLPQFEPRVLTGTVRGFTGATPYARWGNWLVVALLAAVLLAQLPPITKFTMRPRT